LGAWATAIGELAQAASHADVARVLGNPKVSAAQAVDLLQGLAKGAGSAEVKNFLGLLAKNDRLAVLPEIASQFEALKNAAEGEVEATVYSAFPMDSAQIAALAADLGKKFGRKVKAHVVEDKSLIGGIKAVVGDRVIDASVKGKLEALKLGMLAA
jgi:F-type H+-transporting ATPase subunit delta